MIFLLDDCCCSARKMGDDLVSVVASGLEFDVLKGLPLLSTGRVRAFRRAEDEFSFIVDEEDEAVEEAVVILLRLVDLLLSKDLCEEEVLGASKSIMSMSESASESSTASGSFMSLESSKG